LADGGVGSVRLKKNHPRRRKRCKGRLKGSMVGGGGGVGVVPETARST